MSKDVDLGIFLDSRGKKSGDKRKFLFKVSEVKIMKVEKIYKELSEIYDKKFVDASQTKREVKNLAKFLKKGRVLDAGCGTGRHAIPLAKLGFDVVGIDLSGEMLKIAKNKAQKEGVDVKFVRGNVCKTDFPEDYFTNIICMFSVFSELLEGERIKCLKEFRRILRNRGILVIEMPNLEAFLSLGYEKLTQKGFRKLKEPGDFIFTIKTHKKTLKIKTHLFSVFEAKYMLQLHGFKIKQIFGIGFKKFDSIKSSRFIIVAENSKR
jgi:ubiquinone/menaquinone biosynthesis C-methylase UbiE